MSKEKHLIRAAGVMGFFTAISRVLGFVRDSLIAAVYGTSAPAQAFVVAFRIPNLLRDMVGEGASNAAFVPVFSRTRTLEGEKSWVTLAQAMWTHLLIGFLLISVIGVVGAPWLVRLVAPGFHNDPALLALTTRLTRILFPFIGLVGISAFFMGLLNSKHHFALPSAGPVLLNVSMIAGLFLYRPDAMGLAWGVIVGGVLQLALQWPLIRKTGVSLWPRLVSHPGVRQIRGLLLPRMVGTGVYQMGVLVDTVFASFQSLVGAGGIAALYFAHRFLHLPLALFGISMAQATLPTLSAQAASNDHAAMKRTSLMALRSSLLIAVPSTVGLIVLGYPMVQTLLERGAFSAAATRVTVVTLQCYAVGLISMCATKVLANAFYAMHDTWTPVRSAARALALNVVLNLILVFPMKLAGLALATSASSTWNSWHLYRELRQRWGDFGPEFSQWAQRVTWAALLMGALVWGIWMLGARTWNLTGLLAGGSWLLVTLVVGVSSFFWLAQWFGVEEAGRVIEWIRSKNPLFKRS